MRVCSAEESESKYATAPPGAGNRRFRRVSAPRARIKPPHKTDLLWETLRALNHPGRAQTVEAGHADVVGVGGLHVGDKGSVLSLAPHRVCMALLKITEHTLTALISASSLE
jgi:hypothetical protein